MAIFSQDLARYCQRHNLDLKAIQREISKKMTDKEGGEASASPPELLPDDKNDTELLFKA